MEEGSVSHNARLRVKFVLAMKINARSMIVSLVSSATIGIIKTVFVGRVIKMMQDHALGFRTHVGPPLIRIVATKTTVSALFRVVGTLT
jgi:hypothetical protein